MIGYLMSFCFPSGEVPFLDGAAGKAFTGKTWKELVAECSKYEPELGQYA